MKKTALTLLIGILTLTGTFFFQERSAYACSCASFDAAEKLERSAAVFTGTVIGKGGTKQFKNDRSRKYTFEVKTAWKGVSTPRATVYSLDGDSASCGYSFARGKTYLVYAYEEDGMLKTSLCSGNQPIGTATVDIEQLGAGVTIEREGIGGGTSNGWIVLAAAGASLLLFVIFLWGRRRKQS